MVAVFLACIQSDGCGSWRQQGCGWTLCGMCDLYRLARTVHTQPCAMLMRQRLFAVGTSKRSHVCWLHHVVVAAGACSLDVTDCDCDPSFIDCGRHQGCDWQMCICCTWQYCSGWCGVTRRSAGVACWLGCRVWLVCSDAVTTSAKHQAGAELLFRSH